jgi:hypothetical protein
MGWSSPASCVIGREYQTRHIPQGETPLPRGSVREIGTSRSRPSVCAASRRGRGAVHTAEREVPEHGEGKTAVMWAAAEGHVGRSVSTTHRGRR